MIESFNDFLKKSGYSPVFEEKETGGTVVHIGPTEDELSKPEFVTDDTWLTKISSIVLKNLKRNLNKVWMVYPYVIKANGNKSVMIESTDGICLVLFKQGIEKVISIFNGNPVENDGLKPITSVSTSQRGFLNVVRTVTSIIADFNTLGVNEAYSVKPYDPSTGKGDKYDASAKIKDIVEAFNGKPRETDKAIPREYAKKFFELFETNDDMEITKLILEEEISEDPDSPDYDEDMVFLAQIQKRLYVASKGEYKGMLPKLYGEDGKVSGNALNVNNRVTKTIRMALCGATAGANTSESLLRSLWFFGAAKGGKLCVEIDDNSNVVVTDSVDELDEQIEEIEFDMNEAKSCTLAMLRYVQSGGKSEDAKELEDTMNGSRCLVISGLAGIGKSKGINDAIKETRALEDIDYHRTEVTTELALYKEMYKYSNAVLIFEEAEDLFSDNGIINLMKKALDPNPPREIKSSSADAATVEATGKENNTWYVQRGKTRREKYYKEVGAVSEYDRKQREALERKKIEDRERKRKIDALEDERIYTEMSSEDIDDEVKVAVDDWVERQHTTHFPTSFSYNGFWIVTTNKTFAQFNDNKNFKPHWRALTSRSYALDINPKPKVLWAWIKKKLDEAANNKDLLDEQRIIPLVGAAEDATYENVIAFIDSVMDGKFNKDGKLYGNVEFRKLEAIGKKLRTPVPRKTWEKIILRRLLIDRKVDE